MLKTFFRRIRQNRPAALIFTLLLLFPALTAVLSVRADAFSGTSAEGAILIEASGGDVIYEHNADRRLPMASTTKIMTALCAIESGDIGRRVKVSPAAVGVEGSSVYLTAGEELTLEDLLYALMLASANDAATAIAIEVSGSVEDFAALMNERAVSLGCENTHFTNPHGLDNEEHYTTARDLAAITAAALGNETFRTIVSTYKHTIPMPQGGVRLLLNHNRLLRTEENVIGVKTGFTRRSGRCLVTAAERGGVTVIAVTLHDPDDWRDHSAMLELGLDSYRCEVLAEAGSLSFPVPVAGGTGEFVIAANDSRLDVCLPADAPTPRRVVNLDRFIFAPITEGDILGYVEWFDGDGQSIGTLDLIAKESVPVRPRATLWDRITGFFHKETDDETIHGQ